MIKARDYPLRILVYANIKNDFFLLLYNYTCQIKQKISKIFLTNLAQFYPNYKKLCYY